MEYLGSFKYPLLQMLDERELESDMLFIEHIAEQSILSSLSGEVVSAEVYDILDRVGVTMIKAASKGEVTNEQTRIFEKIMSAVKLSVPVKQADPLAAVAVLPLTVPTGSLEE